MTSEIVEDYKMLFFEKNSDKILVPKKESDKILAEKIEKVVKENGFLEDEEFLNLSNLTIICSEENEWKYLTEEGFGYLQILYLKCKQAQSLILGS